MDCAPVTARNKWSDSDLSNKSKKEILDFLIQNASFTFINARSFGGNPANIIKRTPKPTLEKAYRDLFDTGDFTSAESEQQKEQAVVDRAKQSQIRRHRKEVSEFACLMVTNVIFETQHILEEILVPALDIPSQFNLTRVNKHLFHAFFILQNKSNHPKKPPPPETNRYYRFPPNQINSPWRNIKESYRVKSCLNWVSLGSERLILWDRYLYCHKLAQSMADHLLCQYGECWAAEQYRFRPFVLQNDGHFAKTLENSLKQFLSDQGGPVARLDHDLFSSNEEVCCDLKFWTSWKSKWDSMIGPLKEVEFGHFILSNPNRPDYLCFSVGRDLGGNIIGVTHRMDPTPFRSSHGIRFVSRYGY